MPEYPYKCLKCGTRFSIIRSVREDWEPHCPKCSDLNTQRVFIPIGVVYKGGGFYQTDNRKPLTDEE
jgi:putative FmdB family regulatory protein